MLFLCALSILLFGTFICYSIANIFHLSQSSFNRHFTGNGIRTFSFFDGNNSYALVEDRFLAVKTIIHI